MNPNGSGDEKNPSGSLVKPDPVLSPVSEPIDVYQAFDLCYSENDMPYRIYYPSDYSEKYAYPVLLFLHGAGERGTDNQAQLKNVLQDLFNDTESPIYQSIVIVPQCPLEEQWVNTPFNKGSYDADSVEESLALEEARAILEFICDTDSVNRDCVYVMGLSMGGYGTWNILMNHSDYFAAGMPICGAGDPQKAENLKDMPIYAFHGDTDTVVPTAGTREMYQAILAAGGNKITYYEVESTGHNCWTYAASRADVIRALFGERRNAGQ